jgi:hypothetical protein
MAENPPPRRNQVRKIFQCSVCKKQHEIFFDKDLAKNRDRYPFEHVYLHKIDTTNINEQAADVLTTLYLDADLNIRGAEAVKLISSDIFSKDDTSAIINKLTNHIIELQQALSELTEKYNALLKKTNGS